MANPKTATALAGSAWGEDASHRGSGAVWPGSGAVDTVHRNGMNDDTRSLSEGAREASRSAGTDLASHFDVLMGQCRPELMRYLSSRVHSADDAADIAQDACARLVQYRDNPTIGDLRLMLFRIANNLLTDFYRRNSRHHTESHVALDDAGPLQAPDRPHIDRISDQQTLLRLKIAIAQLPDKCRAVFMLSRFDGLSHKQIAERVGISVKMVEKHITRALVSCQRVVGERDA